MSKYQNKYRIESTRLLEYDYSQIGYYYITICTENKSNYFGKIQNDNMYLNKIGEIANKYWLEIPEHFPNVKLDEYIIMPNHIHGIIFIKNNVSKTKSDANVETRHALSQNQEHPNTINDDKQKKLYKNNDMGTEKISITTSKIPETRHALSLQRQKFGKPKSGSISVIIGTFKSACTKQINIINQTPGFSIWQRNYYEHIIRNEKSLYKIRHYIKNNPLNWNKDDLFNF